MPEIQMPKLSDTMTEGTLVSWKKKVGDRVSAGEVLAEIETDKATMEWESTEDGVLQKIVVQEGQKANVGDPIAVIGDSAEPTAEEQPAKSETEKPAPASARQAETAPPQQTAPSKKPPVRKPEAAAEEKPESGRIKASPLARKIAAEKNINLTTLTGSGPGGRIVEKDVVSAAPAEPPAAQKPKSTAPVSKIAARQSARIALTGMRKVIADRLVSSLGPIPHFYLNIEADADPLMRIRSELKSGGEESEGAKLTVNDFILKAAVMAAVEVPKVNASFDGDAIVQYADVDLGIAVAIEDGLLTPVIRGAQNKSLREISETAKDLAYRARHKRMKPEEFQGGTFTVSNLGGMGIDNFSAVINPPQAFILAIGRINQQPVVATSGDIVAGHRMAITMSCDHRVVDGALGATYLKELRRLLENPSLLFL